MLDRYRFDPSSSFPDPGVFRAARGARRLLAATVAAAFLALPVLSCFSDRDGLTGPLEGECAFSIDDDLLGSDRTLIAIRGFAFVPPNVTVEVGTTVTWVNCEPEGTERHTTTSDDGVWASELLDRGQTFSQRFDDVGVFSYFCMPHPFMQGEVAVVVPEGE